MEKKAKQQTSYVVFDDDVAGALVQAGVPATATTIGRLAEILRGLKDCEVIVLVETGAERACLAILRDGAFRHVTLYLRGTQKISSTRFHVSYSTEPLPGLGSHQVTKVRLAADRQSPWLKPQK